MTLVVRAFFALTALLALALGLSIPGGASDFQSAEVFNVAAFIAIGILAEGMAIDFRFGAGKQAPRSSLAFLPFLSSIVIFPPRLAVAIVASVVAFSQFILRRNDFYRGTFNVAMGSLSASMGALAYMLFAGTTHAQQTSYIGYFALAAAFFSTNVLLSSIALALLRHQSIRQTLGQVAGSRGANLWYDLLASPIALVPAAMYYQYGNSIGLLIIILPLLLIRYSYLSKIQLEEANRDLLTVLVKAIETRDPYTSGHSVRVKTLARAIAEDLEIPLRQVERVETAALLHDIGKIDAVYEAVIRKPYDLNSDERELIRTHATRGADLLESLSSVHADVIRAVRHHHERFDGSGYPTGLKGDDIPISARIIMLCDSIDAMLSDRPYRKALSIEKTRLELLRCSGTQFDPAIVRAILQRDTLERASWLAERPETSTAITALSHSA